MKNDHNQHMHTYVQFFYYIEQILHKV